MQRAKSIGRWASIDVDNMAASGVDRIIESQWSDDKPATEASGRLQVKWVRGTAQEGSCRPTWGYYYKGSFMSRGRK